MFPVIILAGGLATRLGDLTKEIPKSLLPINDKPFINYQLESLESQGLNTVIICTGHLGKKITEYLEKNYTGSLNISFSNDGHKPLLTGGAIKKASAALTGPFFVLYGDSYLDITYKDVEEAYEINTGPLMVIYKNQGLFDVSNVHLTEEGFFYSKKKGPNKKSNYIDYGLSIFEKRHFKSTKKSFDLSILQETFSDQGKLQYFVSNQRFYEIGSHAGIDELSSRLEDERN